MHRVVFLISLKIKPKRAIRLFSIIFVTEWLTYDGMTEEPKETIHGVKRKEAPELGEDLPVSPVKVSFFATIVGQIAPKNLARN